MRHRSEAEGSQGHCCAPSTHANTHQHTTTHSTHTLNTHNRHTTQQRQQAYNLQGRVTAAYAGLLARVDAMSVRASLVGGAALGYAVSLRPPTQHPLHFCVRPRSGSSSNTICATATQPPRKRPTTSHTS